MYTRETNKLIKINGKMQKQIHSIEYRTEKHVQHSSIAEAA